MMIVYVQSNLQSHYLGLLKPDSNPINEELHRQAAAPAWSPDGTKIAFFGEAIDQLGGIYAAGNGIWLIDLIDAQGENPQQLVQVDHVKNIAWSPDDTKLAFEVDTPDEDAQIRVVDSSDGRELDRFSGQQPAWSPDSRELVIRGCLPGCGLWIVAFDGSTGRQITFNSTDSYPSWSPTGEYVAFASQPADNDWEIYRLDLANKELLNLTDRPGTDVTPVFSPDGREIYLRSDYRGGSNHWDLIAISVAGDNERLIREGVGPSDDWGLARPAVR